MVVEFMYHLESAKEATERVERRESHDLHIQRLRQYKYERIMQLVIMSENGRPTAIASERVQKYDYHTALKHFNFKDSISGREYSRNQPMDSEFEYKVLKHDFSLSKESGVRYLTFLAPVI